MKIEQGQSVIFDQRIKLRVSSINKGADGKTYYELWSGRHTSILTEEELNHDIERGVIIPLEKDA